MSRSLQRLAVFLALCAALPAYALPPTPTREQIAEARALIERGDAAVIGGRIDEAVELFDQAHKVAPSYLGPPQHKALALAKAGRCAEAMPILQNMIARYEFPDHPDNDAGTAMTLRKEPLHADSVLVDLRKERDQCAERLTVPPKLVVNTKPQGADVRVDSLTGPVVGTTPFDTDSLSVGAHTIIVTLDGYRTETRKVDLHNGTSLVQDIPLVAVPKPKVEPVPTGPPTTTTVVKTVEVQRRRWFDFAISAGASLSLYTININPPQTPPARESVTLDAGVTVYRSRFIDLRLGAFVGFSDLQEDHSDASGNTTSSSDLYVSLLFAPGVRMPVWQRRLFLDLDLGLGAFIISGVRDQGSYIINGTVSGQNAYTLFTLRPAFAVEFRVTPLFFVKATVAYDYTPTDSYMNSGGGPAFNVDSFDRLELTAGLGLRL